MNNKNIPAISKDFDYTELFKKFNSRNEIKKNENENTRVDEVEKKWHMNDKILELFTNNIEEDQGLRNNYAFALIIILCVMLIALITIFILVGCGVLNYSETTFNLFVTGGIAEVFVLVRLIVKYLFKDNLTNALTIILKHNNTLKYNKAQQKPNWKDVNKNSDKSKEI